MARRLTSEDLIDEVEHEDLDDIEDVYLENVEDDHDYSNSATPPHHPPCDTSDTP